MSNAKITVQKSEMRDKSYTLSGSRAFLYRYADTGFRTKWCGIWAPPYKLFEYFAFKVNDTWLSPETSLGFSIERGIANHSFSAGGIDAHEISFVQRKIPAAIMQLNLKNTENAKKSVCVELETAVNMRTKSENFHSRAYETEFFEKTNAAIIKSGSVSCAFGLGKTGKKTSVEFSKNGTYKEHSPGGELQRCFVPGTYKVFFELGPKEEILLPFVFAGAISDKESIQQNYEVCFHDAGRTHILKHSSHSHTRSEIVTPDKDLNDTFAFSASNVNDLIYESAFGKCFFAGYPWFLEFWGRDTFWSIKGLVDLGEFSAAKEILATMAKFQKERMPCLVNPDSSAQYYAADADALFLCALDYYIAQSGDCGAEKEFAKNIAASLKSLACKNGFAAHGPKETWMDSLSRNGTAIEIQSLWTEALKKRDPKVAEEMLVKLNTAFWNAETKYMNDTAGESVSAIKTSNALIPLMFGQIKDSRADTVLESVKKELRGPYGIATLSRLEKNYGPAKYHEGASWGLTSAIGACAFLKYGWPDSAYSCLKAMAADSKRHNLGGMSECLNSETGELIGCGMQLWSAALFVHAIDRYLFGISRDKNVIHIEPQMPLFWKSIERKNKTLGNDSFSVSISKIKTRYEFHIIFNNAPKGVRISLEVPDLIESALVNGANIGGGYEPEESGALSGIMKIKAAVLRTPKRATTKTVEFEAKKNNTAVIRTI